MQTSGLGDQVFQNRVGFAVGTGRCGTNFFNKVVDLEPKVSSTHERNPFNEAFHRYSQWYGLKIDDAGFISTKSEEIRKDLEACSYSFEASAHLSLSIEVLYKTFNAKFLLLVRSPEKVVSSYIRKGWYSDDVVRNDAFAAPGYQPNCKRLHHFLGRIAPSGEEYVRWRNMSRVGKLGWYWNTLNSKVLEQFSNIPHEHFLIQKLEDLSYERYLDIAHFLGYSSSIRLKQYERLVRRKPNRSKSRLRSVSSWTEAEVAEFETEVKPMAEKFGYRTQIRIEANP